MHLVAKTEYSEMSEIFHRFQFTCNEAFYYQNYVDTLDNSE